MPDTVKRHDDFAFTGEPQNLPPDAPTDDEGEDEFERVDVLGKPMSEMIIREREQ